MTELLSQCYWLSVYQEYLWYYQPLSHLLLIKKIKGRQDF
nr:MAG TPA: hypothetical protein [Bacteriophage sp.]